jgi:two-component system, NarL family, nitrate/nitrite response regulator NarL
MEALVHVLLIDDHELIWSGTRRLLERVLAQDDPAVSLDMTAVASMREALSLPPTAIDLILLDYHLPDCSGIEALEAVRAHFEHAPVCVLSAEASPRKVRGIVEAGAAGFLPKSYAMADMEMALRIVLRHKVYLPAEFVLAADSTREAEPDEVPAVALTEFLARELSPRQREVLALAMRGMPIKLISRELGIAEGTVKVHLSMVYKAMGVRNRTDALCRLFHAGATAGLSLTNPIANQRQHEHGH